MRISDWSSDVCSSDLPAGDGRQRGGIGAENPRTEADGRNKRQFSQGVPFALGKAALPSGHDPPGPCIPRRAGTNRLQPLGDPPTLAPPCAPQEPPPHRPDPPKLTQPPPPPTPHTAQHPPPPR